MTEFVPEENIVECLYGPPEMLETYHPATEFVPEENEPEDVYGPPSMLGADDPEEGPENTAAETTKEGPENTAAETTKEEPESTAAETTKEEPEPVTPETCYEPSRNEMIALYGPPEMFRQMETAVPQADEPAQGPGEAAGTGARK